MSKEEGAEILEVTEKHGPLYNAIPCMPLPLAVFCCVFNIVVPGLGNYALYFFGRLSDETLNHGPESIA